jgi:hypothetical protein
MSKSVSFQSFIRPAVTLLTTLFFFTVIAAGLYLDKLNFDRAVDTLSGIFGWTVGYFFAKREQDKQNGHA